MTAGPAPAGATAEAGSQPASLVVRQWAHHHSLTRQLAARIARELALRPDHSPVESSMKLARRHGASNTMAASARYLLMGAGLVYKSGRHYYEASPADNGSGNGTGA